MLSFAEFHNLLKIPVLFQHFKEHRQLNPSISFWSFIKIHYQYPPVVDDDYQRDRQLPFRDADCCLVTSTNVCVCQQFLVGIAKPADDIREFHLYNEINKPQFHSFDIFQPPRSNC